MRLDLTGKSPLDYSIEILRHYEPPEGYWLAFSGGKDSVVLHRLAEMAGVKFEAHHSLTTIDAPETIHFMRRHYPNLIWDRPDHSFYWYVERKTLPMRNRRWCCEVLKESGGDGRVVLTGIRAAESSKRARRPLVDNCLKHPSRLMIHPIRDWSNAEVWGFIRKEQLPYCELYDQGWKRIGCVVCPFERQVKRSRARWPGIWNACLRATRRGWNSESWRGIRANFGSPEEAFEWWCRRDAQRVDPDDPQFGLFT